MISSRNKSKLYTKKTRKLTELNINKYQTYVKLLNKPKHRAKITLFKTSFHINKQNAKQLWKILKQAISNLNNKANIPRFFIINYKTVTDESAITKDLFRSPILILVITSLHLENHSTNTCPIIMQNLLSSIPYTQWMS
ncbi:hypothetical protein LSH36_1186g01024 [Paralvinella palmiformis]|uniref:Uncharacterized protein n=1 Tax=Paralvinella palmiformis TaxID=53620 RepID=A0AAD9IVF7_9ANNE|nr:hypothetical protein LSH36_1186g01024 [Paralvinella palmiformis]